MGQVGIGNLLKNMVRESAVYGRVALHYFWNLQPNNLTTTLPPICWLCYSSFCSHFQLAAQALGRLCNTRLISHKTPSKRKRLPLAALGACRETGWFSDSSIARLDEVCHRHVAEKAGIFLFLRVPRPSTLRQQKCPRRPHPNTAW